MRSAASRSPWAGCTVASKPYNNTTIGLPVAPVRGTIIKSRIVSSRTVGNGEEWQRRNEKQRHGAQRRAKNARNSACRQGLGPCLRVAQIWNTIA